jgi:hypothetical protein
MFDLVVAKYKENISWVDSIPFRKFIYNKDSIDYPNSIKLENIGREAHTWAYHVVFNYEHLAEYTIFVQGDPFYHFHNFIEIAMNLPRSLSALPFYGEGVYGLADINQPEDIDFLRGRNVRPDLVLRLIKHNDPDRYMFPFAWGAQYIVHRDNLRSKSIEFWEKLIYIHQDSNAHWPWSIERCWADIFAKDNSFKDQKKLFF